MFTRGALRLSTPGRSGRDGAAIILSLAFILIVSLSISALLQFSSSQRRITRTQLEREAVYYAAESGIDQVVHYFNYPEDWTADVTLFEPDATTGEYLDSGGNSVFQSRLGGSPMTLIDGFTNSDLIVFTNGQINGGERARVGELTLSMPEAGDPADGILVVTSTGMNSRGVLRTVRAVIGSSPTFGFGGTPAAIVSHIDVGSNGQMNLHWGEAWTRTDMTVTNMNNITTTSDDSHVNYRTEGFFKKSNGKFATGYGGGGGFSDSPLMQWQPNYDQPWLGWNDDHTNIYQHWDFTQQFEDAGIDDWSDLTLDYEDWKTAAQIHGTYYSTDASGNIYRGSVQSDATLVTDFKSEIDQASEVSVNSGTPGDQTLPQPLIVFVDTIDGNPPVADGSNLCDISITGGGGMFTRGLLYVAGDLYIGGSGSPPAVWIQNPEYVQSEGASGAQELVNIRFMGLLYTSGTYAQQGNAATYGAIIAENGFGTGGTPDVWYDESLRLGLPFSFTSEVSVALWQEMPIDAL